MPAAGSRRSFVFAVTITAIICVAAIIAAVWANHREAVLWAHEFHVQMSIWRAGVIPGLPNPGTFIVDPSAGVVAAGHMALIFSVIAVISFIVLMAIIGAYCGLGRQKASLLVLMLALPVMLLIMTTLTLHMYAGDLFVWVQNRLNDGSVATPLSTTRFAVYLVVDVALFLMLYIGYARLMVLLRREPRDHARTFRPLPLVILTVLFVGSIIAVLLAFRSYKTRAGSHYVFPMWPFGSVINLSNRLSRLATHYRSVEWTVVFAAVSIVLLILMAILAAVQVGRLRTLPILQLLFLMAIPLLLPIPVSRGISAFNPWLSQLYAHGQWLPDLWQSAAILAVEVALFAWTIATLRKISQRI